MFDLPVSPGGFTLHQKNSLTTDRSLTLRSEVTTTYYWLHGGKGTDGRRRHGTE
jgi:hypothetical protein